MQQIEKFIIINFFPLCFLILTILLANIGGLLFLIAAILTSMLVIILSVYHFFLFYCLRKFSENIKIFSSRFYRIINEIPTILLIGIIFVIVLKPL